MEAGQIQLLAVPELICIEVSSSLVKRILNIVKLQVPSKSIPDHNRQSLGTSGVDYFAASQPDLVLFLQLSRIGPYGSPRGRGDAIAFFELHLHLASRVAISTSTNSTTSDSISPILSQTTGPACTLLLHFFMTSNRHAAEFRTACLIWIINFGRPWNPPASWHGRVTSVSDWQT